MLHCFISGCHGVGEVSPYLEDFAGILVIGVQNIVKVCIADNHDFQVQCDRFRSHPCRCEEVEGIECLRFKTVGLERAFQSLPDTGFQDGIEQVDHEETPIGFQQRAGVNAAEIGRPDSGTVDDTFEGSEQVFKVGIVFHNNGLGLCISIVDQQIHLVGLERVSLGKRNGYACYGRLLRPHAKSHKVFRHVLCQVIEIGVRLFTVIFFLQFVDGSGDTFQKDVTVHLFKLFLHLPLHIADFQENPVHLFRQLVLLGFYRLILLLWIFTPVHDGFQLFHRNRLIVDDGHHHRARHLAHLNLDNGEPLFFDAGVKILEKLFPLFLILFKYFLFHRKVVLTLEKHGDVFFQVFHKRMDVIPELPSQARLEAKQRW
ncbi:MAG: hypothetical protein A4E66_02336 [Syntrophus sp. PtaB.Bin001]|nr:MAG: hypothetical protein A4E66_02336 [Syntrophus sp. PtaB.Bin001]